MIRLKKLISLWIISFLIKSTKSNQIFNQQLNDLKSADALVFETTKVIRQFFISKTKAFSISNSVEHESNAIYQLDIMNKILMRTGPDLLVRFKNFTNPIKTEFNLIVIDGVESFW